MDLGGYRQPAVLGLRQLNGRGGPRLRDRKWSQLLAAAVDRCQQPYVGELRRRRRRDGRSGVGRISDCCSDNIVSLRRCDRSKYSGGTLDQWCERRFAITSLCLASVQRGRARSTQGGAPPATCSCPVPTRVSGGAMYSCAYLISLRLEPDLHCDLAGR